jgi:hypothetical protein
LKRKLSAKSLKIVLRPGAELSAHFNNRRDCYKIVERGNVLGYVVSPGGGRNVATIYPLYSALIHIKVSGIWHMLSSYEQGDRLNDYTFHAAYQDCTLATIASQAIAALEERRAVQQPVKQAPPKRGRRG